MHEIALASSTMARRLSKTFGNVSEFEAVIAAEGLRRPAYVLPPVWLPLLLWQRAGQEPEGNAGEEQEGRRHEETQPPGAHPAGILGSDGHAVCRGGRGGVEKEIETERCAQLQKLNTSISVTMAGRAGCHSQS